MNILAGGLGQGVGQGVQTGISNAMESAALQKALGMVPQNAGLMEQLQALSGASPEGRNFALQNFVAPQQAAQAKQAEHQRAIELENIKQQGRIEAAQARAGKAVKGEIPPQQRALLQDSYDRMTELLNQGNLGKAWLSKAGLNRSGVEQRAEFDGLRVSLESIIKDMVSKGVLAKDRFNFMLENIPEADDSDRVIKGKLAAIGRELGLDMSQLPDYDKKKAQPNFRQTKNQSNNQPQVYKNEKTGELGVWNGTRMQPYQGKYEQNP